MTASQVGAARAAARDVPPPVGERVRCFVGLPLPEEWGAALESVVARLSRAFSSRIAWTPPGNWHVTLRFLGEVETERLPDVITALSGVDFAPFAMRPGPAGSFGGGRGDGAPRTLWAGLAEGGEPAAVFAARVNAALAPLGFEPGAGRGFRAHITLGRVRTAVEGDDWGLVGRALAAERFDSVAAWTFILWRSALGRGGPRYFELWSRPGS